MKKEIIKEFNIARAFAIICMIAVHTEFAVYNYNNSTFATVFDYLGSPFAAPTFMFILGANIILSSKGTPKNLLIRGISMLGTSYLFNIICHALPFLIIDNRLGITNAVENGYHWIYAVDILSFAALAFIFFAFVKKYKISNKVLIVIAILSCLLNTFLVKNYQIDFNTNPLLAGFTSLFYNSSITGYFSFLSWIPFPIAGYIFVQKLLETKNKDKFYLRLGIPSIIIYLIMVIGSFTIFKESPLVNFIEEYSYYYMNPYQTIGTIFFCLGWISIMYFIAKILPSKLDNTINRLNSNLNNIYLIQWFVINYFLVLPFNGTLKVGEFGFILLFLSVFILSDVLAYLNKKYSIWKKETINV